ncbi:hypothetical protein [Jannaschia sp. LMIT008]|uniref:hypothetical protein n=1 Tax=Jannaschia maritima TaxID=3032585 RepID=UPI002811E981|nr:hypothetical protein [Jannaschia sp. LMIT008]
MYRTPLRLTALAATAMVLVACGSNDDDFVVVDPAPAPIFTKDGRVLDQNRVANQNSTCANGMTREEDLEDGDIDCSN